MAFPVPSATPLYSPPSRVVDMNEPRRQIFLPLMRYILGLQRPGEATAIKIQRIEAWFSTHMPHTYGVGLIRFKQLCYDAIELGLLASDGPLPPMVPQLKKVTLVNGVQYRNC